MPAFEIPVRGGIACLIGLVAQSTLAFGAVTVTTKPSPNRGGAFDTWCPPNANGTTGAKSPLDPAKGDINNAGDQRYFMGESKFDDGTNDIIIRTWCVSSPPTDQGAGSTPRFKFNDFFTYEILTSVGATETQRVAPGTPC